jgi:hypothetical protein
MLKQFDVPELNQNRNNLSMFDLGTQMGTELKNSFGSGSGTRNGSIWVAKNKTSLTARRSFLDFSSFHGL